MTIFPALALVALLADPPRADVVVVVGAHGSADYAPLFAEWSTRWERAAQPGQAHVTVIGPHLAPPLSKGGPGGVETAAENSNAGRTPPNPPSERGREETTTDRDRLKTALEDAAKESDRPLWLVLIGHGTFDR